MKRNSVIAVTLLIATFFFSCTKSAVLNDENSINPENNKARPETETATIIGTINPGDVEATVIAWNEQFTSEPVQVTEKEGTFTIVVPALEYYHLTISYVSPATGNIETFIKPKILVTANSTTNAGIIDLP